MARVIEHRWRWALAAVGVTAAWLALDLSLPVRHDLQRFDGEEVGRLEAGMWLIMSIAPFGS